MTQHLDDHQKDIVALRRLEGDSVSDLAKIYDYTYQGMYHLLKSPDMETRYLEIKEKVERATIQARSKVLIALPSLVDKSLEIALQSQHKDASQERRFLIDKVWPTVAKTDSKIQHEFSGELSQELTGLLRTFNERHNVNDARRRVRARVVEGEDAVPQALPRVTGPDGGNGAASE